MMQADQNGVPKNIIHGMIKHELQLDNFYVPKLNTILVRITSSTHQNPVLKEWWNCYVLLVYFDETDLDQFE